MIISIFLLITIDNKPLFIFLYTMCGLTDLADGYIARKLGYSTSVGAKLDSIADIIFSLVTLYLLFTKTTIKLNDNLIVWILIIGGMRFINMLTSKIKYKQWNVIHTIGNKATGLVLFLIMPTYLIFDLTPTPIIVICLILASISVLEETGILLLKKSYDANRKSLFSKIP